MAVGWIGTGVFGMLLVATPAMAAGLSADPNGCVYVSRSGEVLEARRCVRDGPRVVPGLVARLRFERGLGQVLLRGTGWMYVRRDGRAAAVETFDNGPDYFEEGLTRSRIGGRIAYLDRTLRPRIVTEYDWGAPFRQGRADVCVGCRTEREGEHWSMVGGKWGVIDRTGWVVVPLTLDRPADRP